MTTTDIHTVQGYGSGLVEISDGSRIEVLCEIVYRSEGWVPRWTFRSTDGVVLYGDRRWRYGIAHNTLTNLGVSPTRATGMLCGSRDMAVLTAPSDLRIARYGD